MNCDLHAKHSKILFYISLTCIVINLFVKIGIIYGFEYKLILIFGSIIDAIGITIVAILGQSPSK